MKTISYSAYDYKYVFFGMPGDVDGYLQPGDELFPPVEGLKKFYAEVASHSDTSIRARFALALRCPAGEPHLLAWVSEQVREGVPSFFGEASSEPCPSPASSDDVGFYYARAFEFAHRKGLDEAEADPEAYRHAAAGLLLTDCWRQGDLCTFYKAEWSEWVWYKEFYYTVNTKTGQVLHLADFFDDPDLEALGRLAMRNLENGDGNHVQPFTGMTAGNDFISLHDCCALIDEGLILTFPQGAIASNAEGPFRAVIPYEELEDPRFCLEPNGKKIIAGVRSTQCGGSRAVQHPAEVEQEPVSADSTETDQTFDAAWADSISAITGIGYGPYYYDPSWPLAYSESGKTLLYYPRDSAATHFSIPETVQVIDERAFQCNKHLVEIFLPKNVQEIGVCSFYGCEELRGVTIEGPVTSIPWRAFDGCQKLRTVDLPAFVQSIGGLSFASCGSLRTIFVRNPEPPHFEFEDDPEDFETMGAFFDTDLNRCTLYVPEGSVEAYRQAPGWKLFKQIKLI